MTGAKSVLPRAIAMYGGRLIALAAALRKPEARQMAEQTRARDLLRGLRGKEENIGIA